METALAKYPTAAQLSGFANGFWKQALLSYQHDINQQQVLTPLGCKAIHNLIMETIKYNTALLEFVEQRVGPQNKGIITSISQIPNPYRNITLVFIVGNYRSGTSILHRLLSANRHFAYLPQWALKAPITEITDASQGVQFPGLIDSNSLTDPFRMLSKEMADTSYLDHPMSPDMAEEDGLYWGTASFAAFGLLSHGQGSRKWSMEKHEKQQQQSLDSPWLFGSNKNIPLRRNFFEKTLPFYLYAWLHEDSPLWTIWKNQQATAVASGGGGATSQSIKKPCIALKGPQYSAGLDIIKRVLPQATVIATHREPMSQASGIAMTFLASSPLFVDPSIVRAQDVALNILDHTAFLAGSLAKNKHYIDLNLMHREIVKNPLAAVQQVFEKLGLPSPNEQDIQSMKQILKANEQGVKRDTQQRRIKSCAGVNWSEEVYLRHGFQKYKEMFHGEW
jgi:hypothetical protein